MRIAVLCQYFVPEIGAPSARLSELSREWARLGHEVTVITGLPNHPTGIVPPEYRGVVFRKERLDDVHVWRNWLYATPNEGFVRKTLSHISFMASTAVLTTPRLSGQDVIVVSSPAFFAVISAWFMSRVRRVPYVFEVRDLWPGLFTELGVLKNRLLIRILEGLEMFLYRGAARVVVVTGSFQAILERRGVPAAKLLTVTNGVDGEFFRPGPRDNEISRTHGFGDRFVVLYIGAHGISQGLQSVVEAAARLREHPDIVFAFVGEGAMKAALVEKVHALGLTNVRFYPGQPKALMPTWYAACDVALVPLRRIPMFESFIPSKMFEILACARPVIGAVRGEARGILEQSGGALLAEPEDPAQLADAVLRLRREPGLGQRLAEAGRVFAVGHYDRRALARRYATMLEDVVRERRA